ncbi:MAG: endonuclease/exonuclease/phosphatase family protein [Xanthomarina sp.]
MTLLKKHTIAFYNIENFYEAESLLLKTTFLKWTKDRYLQKILKLGLVIAQIGQEETAKHPAILALAEVENTQVLNDLINSKLLKQYEYRYVFFSSLDKRGMNVALLYDPSVFKVKNSKAYPIDLLDSNGDTDFTRDILYVSGTLEGEKIHLLINHWPSRREKDTEVKRMAAANKLEEIIDSIKNENPEAKILVMGDFNDDPDSPSLVYITEGFELYNALEKLRNFNRGSLKYNRQWHMFDQILLSDNFLKTKIGQWQLESANIYDAQFLKYQKGKHKGKPFRTFLGAKYHGGFSDHFPVYVTVVRK